jgi:hypothetical protein
MSASATEQGAEVSAHRRWHVPGMSYIVFDDGLTIVSEADYHDQGARARSLGTA